MHLLFMSMRSLCPGCALLLGIIFIPSLKQRGKKSGSDETCIFFGECKAFNNESKNCLVHQLKHLVDVRYEYINTFYMFFNQRQPPGSVPPSHFCIVFSRSVMLVVSHCRTSEAVSVVSCFFILNFQMLLKCLHSFKIST